jgi:uncharacterized protein
MGGQMKTNCPIARPFCEVIMYKAIRSILPIGLFFAQILCLPGEVLAQIPVPELTGRVVDLTGTLTKKEIQILEKELADLEARKGSQIAILMISTTDGEVIEDFSMRVAEAWKIGRKGIDDGILITVAKDDRKARIEVGYGLEGVIPDATAKRIISEQMAPEFRNGNYFAGLQAAVSTMARLIDGEKLPPPSNEDEETLGEGFFFGSAISSFVMHWFLPTPLAVILAALATWILSIFFVGFSFVNLFILLLAAVIGVTWYRFSSGGGSSSSAGWSSSGGSSGGFSGGGGSFGGGGASGSW